MIADALRAHLIRLALWAGVSLIVGLALCKRPFGTMTLAWGAINLAIALASLRGGPTGPGFVPFLAFNLGLNLAYIGVGVTMLLLAGERTMIREFGAAIAIQGLALLILDGALYLKVRA